MPTKKSKKQLLLYRSEFLLEVFKDWIHPSLTVLEVGCGDDRNVDYLRKHGYDVEGIDKKKNYSIEDMPEMQFDVIFTMSTLFLIPPENAWVFEKIARMAKKFIITIEGEVERTGNLWGRDYRNVFEPLGFKEVWNQFDVFNQYGVLRVFQKNDPTIL